MNLNKVFVLGNLTRDPERRNLPSGQPVVSFGLATNRYFTSQGTKREETEFHNIVLFGKLAEIGGQYLKKGSMVLIEGRLRTSSWQDQATGMKKYRAEIIGEQMQLGPRTAAATSYEPQKPSEDIPVIKEGVKEEPSTTPEFTEEKEEEIDVKDIPF